MSPSELRLESDYDIACGGNPQLYINNTYRLAIVEAMNIDGKVYFGGGNQSGV
jgi:hypothetical protein